jgi:hypothetical protein
MIFFATTDLVIISVLSVIVELAAFAAFECLYYFDNQSTFAHQSDPGSANFYETKAHINYWTYRRRKKKNTQCQR